MYKLFIQFALLKKFFHEAYLIPLTFFPHGNSFNIIL